MADAGGAGECGVDTSVGVGEGAGESEREAADDVGPVERDALEDVAGAAVAANVWWGNGNVLGNACNCCNTAADAVGVLAGVMAQACDTTVNQRKLCNNHGDIGGDSAAGTAGTCCSDRS